MTVPPFPKIDGVEFRLIPGRTGYAASSDGKIWSCRVSDRWHQNAVRDEWRALKVTVRKTCGRHFVDLTENRVTRHHRVSKLIAEAFIGRVPDGYVVAHYPDRDLGNNNASNLRIVTAQENVDHRKEHGTNLVGSKHHRSVLTEDIVGKIRKLHAQGASVLDMAKMFGLDKSTLHLAISGRTWKHVDA